MPDPSSPCQAPADRPSAGFSVDLFRAAVEQADIAVSITNPQAVIEYVNPAFTRVTGHAAADVVGRNQSLLSNRTTPQGVYAAMWREILAGRTWRGRLINSRRDGQRYLADLTITPVLDAAGRITHFLGLHRDVTELHQLECAVQNQKALIETVVDAAPMVIALLDMNERVLLDNHAYKALSADLGMQEAAQVLLHAVRADSPQAFRAFHGGGNAFSDRHVRLERPHWRSPRWYACSATWIDAADDAADAFFAARREPCLLLVATDVSRQVMERERARVAALQVLLSEEDRRQSLRESLAAAVYQLEGPLNMLESIVNLMQRRSCDPAQAALAEALAAGQRALEALRDAVPPYRPDPEPAPVNLNEAVRDVLDLCAQTFLAHGISVSWQPQLVLPSLHGSPTRLRSMLKALIDNAIEAMDGKGWARRELAIASTSAEGWLRVDITDSGPGIPTGLKLVSFEPFWTTKKDYGRHLGTGLSSAQQVAVDHGGGIELMDAPQGGLRARVSLPLKHADTA